MVRYVKNTDQSVAAGASETLIDIDGRMILREISWYVDGDNGTGDAGNVNIEIIADGVSIFDDTCAEFMAHWCCNQASTSTSQLMMCWLICCMRSSA